MTRNLSIFAFAILFSALTLSAADTSSNYRLRSGDVLSMSIFQEPEMSVSSRVTVEGTIHFPLLGNLNVAGMTLPELQGELYSRYNTDYLVEPQISLNIGEYAERRVRVRGKVNRPGFVVIPPEENYTILDVVAAAGDIAASGNERRVELHRLSEKGDVAITTFDLSSRNQNVANASMLVEADDVIVVPEKLF